MLLRPKKLPRNLLPMLLLLAVAGLFAAPTVALAECTGSSEASCADQSSCSWVGTYARSDGAVVNSFCKNARPVKRSFNPFRWSKSKHDRHDRDDRYDRNDAHKKHKKKKKDLKHKNVKADALNGLLGA